MHDYEIKEGKIESTKKGEADRVVNLIDNIDPPNNASNIQSVASTYSRDKVGTDNYMTTLENQKDLALDNVDSV